MERFQKLAWRLSRNNTQTVWVLKLDILKCFASVDQEILLKILARTIRDTEVLDLCQKIIKSFSSGIPLGNLTSQIFVNIYLNELDQFIKHELKILAYLRYSDDFILAHPDKELLADCLEKIKVFLREQLRIDVHPKKIVLKTYAAGIDCFGYVCFPYHKVLRTKTK